MSGVTENTAYPGRGIVMGATPSGLFGAVAYFVTGRSEKSRNRMFVREADGISIALTGGNEDHDTELIVYRPVRLVSGAITAANGRQSDEIAAELFRAQPSSLTLMEKALGDSLRAYSFEPDRYFTPRIQGILSPGTGYVLSIIKASAGAGAEDTAGRDTAEESVKNIPEEIREFFEYEFSFGTGHLIHTYAGDAVNIELFRGAPREVSIPEDPEDLACEIWDSLAENFRVSLYVGYFPFSGKEPSEIIRNRYE